MDETSNLNPTNPYSASKAAAELLVRSYAISYKVGQYQIDFLTVTAAYYRGPLQ